MKEMRYNPHLYNRDQKANFSFKRKLLYVPRNESKYYLIDAEVSMLEEVFTTSKQMYYLGSSLDSLLS